MNNNINISISQDSCDKIAGIAKHIPSADASILYFKYKDSTEAKISRNYGAFSITGSYKKGTGLDLSIGISDDLIDIGVNAIYTFVPAICGAVCSLAGHVGRLKKLLKINNDLEPVRVKHGDKAKIIYNIGRSTTSRVITIGLAEMGENIDNMLIGMRRGQVYRTDIEVMGTKMPISIMVDKIIDSSDERDHSKIYGSMRLPDEATQIGDSSNTDVGDNFSRMVNTNEPVNNINIDDDVKQCPDPENTENNEFSASSNWDNLMN